MDFERARAILVSSLELKIRDRRVLNAFLKVPRELFVPFELQVYAYEDRPLNIGYGQTISQPYIVAAMAEALELNGNEKVLEIGTGSGYQAAILAQIVKTVYSTERITELATSAADLIQRLGYQNIFIKLADEELGWKNNAPFEAIVVSAASPSISEGLLGQLAIGGRLVIPVGSRWEQELIKVTKEESGNKIERLGGVRFVPLIGKDAWDIDQ